MKAIDDRIVNQSWQPTPGGHITAFLTRSPRLGSALAGALNPMKIQHSTIRTVLAVTLAAIVTLAVTSCSNREEHFQDLPSLLSAIQAFSRDLTKQGQPVPPSVSMSELVTRGYISSNSVRAFQGMEARIWLTANPTVLDSVLMSARLPDGSVSAALADGSVQQFSAPAFALQLKKTGQQGGAANPGGRLER